MSDLPDSDNQLEGFEEGPAIPPERPTGGGRPFVVAITIIGVLVVIALIALGVVLLNRNPGAAADQAARINAQNTQIAAAATEQVRNAQLQQTLNAAKLPSVTIPPTLAPQGLVTNTPVVAIPTSTKTPVPPTPTILPADLTKTSAAATTLARGGTPGTPQATTTALPTTGFADQVGLPGMAIGAVLLLILILIVRRARVSQS